MWLPSSAREERVSDHISGPRALADPIADITDVYAFPSPERSGHLVLIPYCGTPAGHQAFLAAHRTLVAEGALG